jgi:2-isopropylmalate synthase
VLKNDRTYQHVPPESVGNQQRMVVSELGGSSGLIEKLKQVGYEFEVSRDEARALQQEINDLESRGYSFEGADASLYLLARRRRPDYVAPFELDSYRTVERALSASSRHNREIESEAIVKMMVGGETLIEVAEGNGPVSALDSACRKALVKSYPSVMAIHLIDYKVRIIDSAAGTDAAVRVLVESTDGPHIWNTVGASTDVIEASWLALADSLEYFLVKRAGWTPG